MIKATSLILLILLILIGTIVSNGCTLPPTTTQETIEGTVTAINFGNHWNTYPIGAMGITLDTGRTLIVGCGYTFQIGHKYKFLITSGNSRYPLVSIIGD